MERVFRARYGKQFVRLFDLENQVPTHNQLQEIIKGAFGDSIPSDCRQMTISYQDEERNTFKVYNDRSVRCAIEEGVGARTFVIQVPRTNTLVEKLNALEAKIEAVERKVMAVERKVDQVVWKVNGVEMRLNTLQGEVNYLKNRFHVSGLAVPTHLPMLPWTSQTQNYCGERRFGPNHLDYSMLLWLADQLRNSIIPKGEQ